MSSLFQQRILMLQRGLDARIRADAGVSPPHIRMLDVARLKRAVPRWDTSSAVLSMHSVVEVVCDRDLCGPPPQLLSRPLYQRGQELPSIRNDFRRW